LVSVTFGGEAASCTVVSVGVTLDCITPVYPAAESVDVVVTTASGSDTEPDGFTYEEPTISLALNESGLDLTGTIGDLWADYLIANVITNNPSGYHLDVSAAEPRLTCPVSGGPYYIEPLGGSGDFSGSNVNKWGYAVDDGSLTKPSNWTGLTTVQTPIDTFGSATDQTLGRDTVVWFGARVDMSQVACVYGAVVTFTAVVSP
jgi:hypothetical protein